MTETLFESIFPPGVAFVCATSVHLAPTPHGRLHPSEAALLAPGCHPNRVEEFTLGRGVGRLAVSRLRGGVESPPLLRRADGKTPAWPPGITGSLTHSGGWAAAAVARVEDFRGVGVDLERMRPVSNGLAQRILLPPEAAWLADHPRPDQGLMWMFSAKEALYKALHPAGAEGLGFDVAVITFTVEREGKAEGKDFATGSLAWRLVRQAGEGFEPGLRGEGRWSAGKGFVLTGTWLPGLIDNVG